MAPAADPAAPVTPPVAAPAAKTPEQLAADAALLTVPEKYELKNAAGTALDSSLIDAISPVLKDAKMNSRDAQALVNNFADWQQKAIKAAMTRDLETLKADPALGQLNFGRTQQRVNDAITAFSTPEDRAVLVQLGIANNPVLVRMFHRIGSAMQEPTPADGGSPVRGKASKASKLYGGSDLKTSGVPTTRQ